MWVVASVGGSQRTYMMSAGGALVVVERGGPCLSVLCAWPDEHGSCKLDQLGQSIPRFNPGRREIKRTLAVTLSIPAPQALMRASRRQIVH